MRDLIYRLRAGASQRAVARDLGLARMTVQKYAQLAAAVGYLDPARPLPEAAELAAALGPAAEPPRLPSSVEPFRAVVERLVVEGIEMMTIYDRLREPGHGYRSLAMLSSSPLDYCGAPNHPFAQELTIDMDLLGCVRVSTGGL